VISDFGLVNSELNAFYLMIFLTAQTSLSVFNTILPFVIPGAWDHKHFINQNKMTLCNKKYAFI